MVARVGHIDMMIGIHGHARRIEELRHRPRAIGEARHARTGKRGDDARTGDFANPVVGRIGHIEVAAVIHGDAGGIFELGVGAGAVGDSRHPGAGKRRHDSRRGDPPNQVVHTIRHQHVATGVDDDAGRLAANTGERRHLEGMQQVRVGRIL